MDIRVDFLSQHEFEKAVKLFYSDEKLKAFNIESPDGYSLVTRPDVVVLLWEKGIVCSAYPVNPENKDGEMTVWRKKLKGFADIPISGS